MITMAGVKIDAMIADKIFQLKVGLGVSGLSCEVLDCGLEGHGQDDLHWDPVLPYSTDIGCAAKVITEMRKGSFSLVLNDVMGDRWRVCFKRISDSILDWVDNPNAFPTVWEESLPLAICLAALKAKGVAL
jgi:hypothetical protein